MALSQVQCLDDNHVNSRINQSKPEFFYSEEQRLALESLLEDGREGFEEFIKTTGVRSFLSDLEVARLSGLVEAFSPGSHGASGDSVELQGSLQYWPDRSDTSLPDLDMGWPDSAAYRGVTRAQVYAQPPLEGDVHIKEVVRKTIAQAQKVIAVVMDLFTDADIFKDLLDASFKRKVPVYLILEATGIPHFLKMCERMAMHTGHLKNLRVRSIRGIEFCSRSSKKVCGSQSQKFMFVDGDKTVSGSYSFTWAASRLDRNVITVLTGQAADAFDKLFREMYAMSNVVNLNKVKLNDEPKPEPTPQTSSAPLPSATMALKLINPKYALVSSSATAKSNRTPSERCTTKNENIKQTKDVPEAPQIHPGLLHLEKANMIAYLPVWPEPDSSNDVIGFINIRDFNKPLQSHLMRSERFEVSQAIRFKDPFHVAEEPLPDKASPKPKREPLYQLPNSAEQPLMPPHTSQEENDIHAKPLDLIIFPPCSHTEKAEFVSLSSNEVKDGNEVKDTPVVYGMGNQIDYPAKQGKEIYINSVCLAKTITDSSSCEQCTDLELSVNAQLQTVTSSHTSLSKPENSLIAQLETTSVKQMFHKPEEPIKRAPVQDSERHKVKKEADTNKTKGVDMPCHSETSKHNSNISSTSEEYYDCSDCLTVDSGFKGMVQGMLTCSGVSEQDGYPACPNTIVTHTLSNKTKPHQQLAPMTSSGEPESGSRNRKETEEPYLDCGLQEKHDVQHETEMTIHSEREDTEDALLIEADRLSELILQDDKLRIQEADASSSESKPLPNSLETITDAQVAHSKVCKELSVHELGHVPYSVANNMSSSKLVEVRNTMRIQSELSKNKLSNSVLQGKGALPVILVQTKTELQSIVFSDRVKVIPLHSEYTYASKPTPTIEKKNIKQSRYQEKVADLRAVLPIGPHAKTVQEEHYNHPSQFIETEEMMNVKDVEPEQAVKVKRVFSSTPELKENEAEQTVDIKGRAEPPQQKTLIGLKFAKHSADAHFSARKRAFSAERLRKDEQVREHTYTNRVHRTQPEAKPNLVGEVRKPQEDRGSTKASVTKLHSSNHPTRPHTSTHALNYLHRNQPRQNRASNSLPTLPDKFSTRHTAPSRSSQSQLGRSRTEPSPGHLSSSQKKPQSKLDRTKPIQLVQPRCTERSASTTEDSSSSSSTTFQRRSRSLKEKTAGYTTSSQKITWGINDKEQE